MLTGNPNYKRNRKITVKGIVLHSVGCPQPKASVFYSRWAKNEVCPHAVVDAVTGEYIQCLPFNIRSNHCGVGTSGFSANNTHLSIEMCEPPNIVYSKGASFTCTNRDEAKEYVIRAFNGAVKCAAEMCKQNKLDPTKDGVIISHSEGYKRGVASNHADPEHLFSYFSELGLSMEYFRTRVKDELNKKEEYKPNEYEQWAIDNGLFVGDGKGNFNFNLPLTRGQAAIVLKRLYDILSG